MKENVLCASSAYEQKYYFNEKFDKLPESIKEELQIMAVMFTEDVGGIFLAKFEADGMLMLETVADEGDLLYDEIGAGLKIKKLQEDKKETFEALEMFYKVFILKQEPGSLICE